MADMDPQPQATKRQAPDALPRANTKKAKTNNHNGQSLTSPGNGKPGQGKPGQGKPGQGKPGQGKSRQGNPEQGKPGQGKPGQGKPGQDKSAQGKSSHQKNGKTGDGAQAQRSNRAARPGRVRDSRVIAAQKCDAALKDGELDVQTFVNSRAFEVNALDESMRRTKTSQSTRAFQQVPHRLRRRAAAHNHKRVPKRLQRKARKEMIDDNTPLVKSRSKVCKGTRSRLRADTARRLNLLARKKQAQMLEKKGLSEVTIRTRLARPKLRRNVLAKPVITATKYKKRQRNKTWLPTHVWHAKRARMTDPKQPLWGFAISLTPNEKVHRPTHRAVSLAGAVAWDTSYMSTIGLAGAPKSLEHALKAVGLTQAWLWSDSRDGVHWRAGRRHWSGILSRKTTDSTKTIGPATVVWDPVDEEQRSAGGEAKGEERRLIMRVHPSIFSEAFQELTRILKGQKPRMYLHDLRYEIGSIEIVGPHSTEPLLGVLKPYHSKPEAEESHASAFQSLAGIGDPTCLPDRCLLAFSVRDPRLHYPPRPVKLPDPDDYASSRSLIDAVTLWDQKVDKKAFGLVDRDSRFKASRLPSQKSLNRRKGLSPPGTALEPTELDPEIPILLLASRQSTVLGQSAGAGKASGGGTWTVMMPWKCLLPIWYGLMHYPLTAGGEGSSAGNPRFGGLNEQRQVAFEQGVPWFPADWVATSAGVAWELEKRLVRKRAWDRRPKGKRVNYDTLDLGAGRKGEIGEGWSCAYETLLGPGKAVATGPTTSATGPVEAEPAPAEPHPLASMTLLARPDLERYLGSDEDPSPSALIMVRITMLGRGVPVECARIYRLPAAVEPSTSAEVPATEPPSETSGTLPPDLRQQWLAQAPSRPLPASGQRQRPRPRQQTKPRNMDLATRQALIAREILACPPTLPFPPGPANHDSVGGHPLCPDAGDLVGFVTTGAFSLRAGRADAIGSISARKAVEELRRCGRRKGKERDKEKGMGKREEQEQEQEQARFCVVRNAGENVGWLARWDFV